MNTFATDEASDSSEVMPGSFRDMIFAVLRTVAETQRIMANEGAARRDRPRLLASVKLPVFDGSDKVTVQRYREWKKELNNCR